MYKTDFWTLWEKARVWCFKRTASKHVYYLGWNRSPAQVGGMRQVIGPGALGRPRGIGWRGRREGGSGWGTHVNPWLIHFNVWQNPLQYCKVISLQLIKKKKVKVKVALSCPILQLPGQNTGVGSLSLLQGIFPTQGSNPGLLHCRRILNQLNHKGSPRILEWVAYTFSRRSSRSRKQTRVSCVAGGFFTNWTIREAL